MLTEKLILKETRLIRKRKMISSSKKMCKMKILDKETLLTQTKWWSQIRFTGSYLDIAQQIGRGYGQWTLGNHHPNVKKCKERI